MARSLKYDIRFAERLTTEYVTCSRLVTHKPCYLFSSLVAPHVFSVDCQARLRNGETVNADILLNLKTQFEQCTHDYHPPVYFNRGLYVELVGEILFLLDDCGDTSDISDWIAWNDGLDPTDNQVYIKEGSHSMALGIDADKDVTDQAYWRGAFDYGDLFDYQNDWVYIWLYFDAVDPLRADAQAVHFHIGNDPLNRMKWYFANTFFVVGWNLLKCDLGNPDATDGVIDWTAIDWQTILVYTDAGNVVDFTVYVDSIILVRPFSGATDGITEGVTVQYLIE